MRLIVLFCAILLLGAPSFAAQNRATPGLVRVRLVTSEGNIVIALDARRAPKTTANFLGYVDDGRLDGTSFYRASRSKFSGVKAEGIAWCLFARMGGSPSSRISFSSMSRHVARSRGRRRTYTVSSHPSALPAVRRHAVSHVVAKSRQPSALNPPRVEAAKRSREDEFP